MDLTALDGIIPSSPTVSTSTSRTYVLSDRTVELSLVGGGVLVAVVNEQGQEPHSRTLELFSLPSDDVDRSKQLAALVLPWWADLSGQSSSSESTDSSKKASTSTESPYPDPEDLPPLRESAQQPNLSLSSERPDDGNARPSPSGPPGAPEFGQGGAGAGRSPLEIGRDDLLPLGGQGGSMALPGRSGSGGNQGQGGMFMDPSALLRDPDDPLRVPGSGGQGQGGRYWGGDGFLPQGSVPPGARFDPVGPGGFGGPPGMNDPFNGIGGGGAGGPRFGGVGGFGGGVGGPPGGRGGLPGFGGPLRGAGQPGWDDFKPPSGKDYNHMFG